MNECVLWVKIYEQHRSAQVCQAYCEVCSDRAFSDAAFTRHDSDYIHLAQRRRDRFDVLFLRCFRCCVGDSFVFSQLQLGQ